MKHSRTLVVSVALFLGAGFLGAGGAALAQDPTGTKVPNKIIGNGLAVPAPEASVGATQEASKIIGNCGQPIPPAAVGSLDEKTIGNCGPATTGSVDSKTIGNGLTK